MWCWCMVVFFSCVYLFCGPYVVYWYSWRCASHACFQDFLAYSGGGGFFLFGFRRFRVRWGPEGPISPHPSLFCCVCFSLFFDVLLLLFSIEVMFFFLLKLSVVWVVSLVLLSACEPTHCFPCKCAICFV